MLFAKFKTLFVRHVKLANVNKDTALYGKAMWPRSRETDKC